MVAFLVASGADVNARCARGRTALQAAASRGSLEIVQLLVSNGADVGAQANDGLTALGVASERGYSNVVEFLRTPRVRTLDSIEEVPR